MTDEQKQKQKKINLIAALITLGVCIVVIVVVVILSSVSRKERMKRLEDYIKAINQYCDEKYPDNYYLDANDDILNVHIWQPGVALYVAMNGMQDVRNTFEGFAKDLYTSLKKRDLAIHYGVHLFLHNDLDTEKIIMWWANGEYQKSDWADSGFR